MSRPKVAIESIMDISPYIPGSSKAKEGKRVIKLSSNENPFGPSPKAVSAMKEAAESAHLYPDGGSIKLREAIAEKNGIDAKRLVCGAGSDELIALICQAYAGQGDEVLYSEYGFLMYPISAMRVGAMPVTAEEKDYRADVNSLLGKVSEKTKILFLANPNNPTGSYLSKDELKRLREGLREDVLLVIDSAYAEYVTADDYDSGAELVESTENTVMLRTFSKLYGLASLRLGWAYAPEAVVDVLNRVRGPFNVSGIAQAAGVAALSDNEFEKKSVEHNAKWLKKLSEELTGLGLKTYPSVGNFILVEFPETDGKIAKDADEFLREQGIIGRKMEAYNISQALRFSIGLDEDNGKLIESLTEFIG